MSDGVKTKQVVTAHVSFSGCVGVSIELTPGLLQEIRLVCHPTSEGETWKVAAVKAFVKMLGDVNSKVNMTSVVLTNVRMAERKDYQ